MDTIGNVTTYGMYGLNNMSSWMPTIGVVLVSVIGIGILLMAFSTNYFKRFFKIFGYIGQSIFYFIKGALTVAAGYLIYYLGNLLGETASHIPFEWVEIAVVFYVGCSLLGYAVTKVYGRLILNYRKSKSLKN